MSILRDFSKRIASEWTRKVEELADAAIDQGWTVSITGGNQYRFVPPDKSQVPVILAGTASDVHALGNSISRLKRSGLIWPWDKKIKKQFNQAKEPAVTPEETKPRFDQIDYAAKQEEDEAKADDQLLNKMLKDVLEERMTADEVHRYVDMMGPEKHAFRKAYNSEDRKAS